MPVNQLDLDYMIGRAPSELSSLTSQVASTKENIAKTQTDHNLYTGMVTESKNSLENRLVNVKVPTKSNPWQASFSYDVGDLVVPTAVNGYVYVCITAGTSGGSEPVWPTVVGNTVIDGGAEWECKNYSYAVLYGATYGVSTLSDWMIVSHVATGPGTDFPSEPASDPVPIYAYSTEVVTLWTEGSGGSAGAEHNITCRTRIVPASGATRIRIRVKGNQNLGTQIYKAFIGEMVSPYPSEDVVPLSSAQITFNGGATQVIISANTIVYSDWMNFTIDPLKHYLFTAYLNNYQEFGGGRTWWVDEDYAEEETWSTLPIVIHAPTGISFEIVSVEGYDSSPTWDADAKIIACVTDWEAINPMITSSPFGTVAMLSALNMSLGIVTTRKNQVATRNNSLIHYTTYSIDALTTGPGTITPSGIVTVSWGEDQTFVFTGTVLNVMVDAINLGPLSSYTFSNVQENHSIRVDFI